jgi:protein translocase SecG subunit
MFGLLMTIFIILSIFLVLFILIQPGKGDMGLGSMGGGGSQMLFGGAGGQGFFEKTTWTIAAIFVLGCLGLTMLRTHETESSQLSGFTAERRANAKLAAAKRANLAQQKIPVKTPDQTSSAK